MTAKATKITFNLPLSYYMDVSDVVVEMNDWIDENDIRGWGMIHQTLMEKGHIEILFHFTKQQDAVIFYFYWSNRIGTDWNFF